MESQEKTLYRQLSQELVEWIGNEFEIGQYIPSERELAKKYQVSRSTIRLTLEELNRLGIIKTIPKKGSLVVNNDQDVFTLNAMYSFSEEMAIRNKKAQTKVLNQEITDFNIQIENQEVVLPDLDQVFYLERLRGADDEPMMIDYTFLPYENVPGIEEVDFNQVSLYRTLEEDYDIILSHADEEIFVDLLTEEQADLLQVPKHSAVIKIFRHTFDIHQRLIEFTISLARADKFKFKTTQRNNRLTSRD